jgi:hypothetical protein
MAVRFITVGVVAEGEEVIYRLSRQQRCDADRILL